MINRLSPPSAYRFKHAWLAWLILLIAGQLTHAQGLGELFPPSIPRAIDRGLAPGGDLEEELDSIGLESITTARQGQALVKLLKALPIDYPEPAPGEFGRSRDRRNIDTLQMVIDLFDNIDGWSAAEKHIHKHAPPEIARLYDWVHNSAGGFQSKRLQDASEMVLLQLLSLLAEGKTEEGTQRVLEALKVNLATDSYYWHDVLAQYNFEHPHSKRVYDFLAKNLPDGALGQSVLWAVNLRAEQENTFDHVFDSDAGVAKFKQWLREAEASQDHEIVSAIIEALPHLKQTRQDEMYKLIDAIDDPTIRLDSASTKARDDEPLGIKQLADLCLLAPVSAEAQSVLEELEKEDKIPAAARRRPFYFEAQIYQHLTLGSEYDSIYTSTSSYSDTKVIDLTVVEELKLPGAPGEAPLKPTLVKFKVTDSDPLTLDQPGVALIDDDLAQVYIDQFETFLSTEDLASVYYFEQQPSHDFQTTQEIDEDALNKLRAQWSGPAWTDEEVTVLCSFGEPINHPQSIAIVKAKLNDDEGFVVVDGPRSHFYPAKCFYPGTHWFDIRKLHVGRVARKLPTKIERPEYQAANETVAHEVIAGQYEQWMSELKNGSLERRKQLLDLQSPFLDHIQEYIASTPEPEQNEAARVLVDHIFDAHQALVANDKSPVLSLDSIYDLLEKSAQVASLTRERAATIFDSWLPLCDSPLSATPLAKLGIRGGKSKEARELLTEHLYVGSEIQTDAMNTLTEVLLADGQVDQALRLKVEGYRDLVKQASKIQLDYSTYAREEMEQYLTEAHVQFPDKFDAALSEAGLAGDFTEVTQNYRKKKLKRP